MNTVDWQSKAWSLSLALFAVYIAATVPSLAFAGNTTIGNVLCRVVGWLTGQIGQGIATIAIVIIGIGALLGKVSWGMAIIVGIGVAVIFGAGTIVGELSPGKGGGCASN